MTDKLSTVFFLLLPGGFPRGESVADYRERSRQAQACLLRLRLDTSRAALLASVLQAASPHRPSAEAQWGVGVLRKRRDARLVARAFPGPSRDVLHIPEGRAGGRCVELGADDREMEGMKYRRRAGLRWHANFKTFGAPGRCVDETR